MKPITAQFMEQAMRKIPHPVGSAEYHRAVFYTSLMGAGVALGELALELLKIWRGAPQPGGINAGSASYQTEARVPPAPPDPAQQAADYLGVSPDADLITIRRAFRRKIRQVHPDLSADRFAHAKTHAAVEARDLLLRRVSSVRH